MRQDTNPLAICVVPRYAHPSAKFEACGIRRCTTGYDLTESDLLMRIGEIGASLARNTAAHEYDSCEDVPYGDDPVMSTDSPGCSGSFGRPETLSRCGDPCLSNSFALTAFSGGGCLQAGSILSACSAGTYGRSLR